jgi:hypothetical protein
LLEQRFLLRSLDMLVLSLLAFLTQKYKYGRSIFAGATP